MLNLKIIVIQYYLFYDLFKIGDVKFVISNYFLCIDRQTVLLRIIKNDRVCKISLLLF